MHILRLTVFGLSLALAMPASAARCGKRADVVAELDRNWKEQLRGYGIVVRQGLIELFVSEGGSWTVIGTRPNGWSCKILGGHNWEMIPDPPTEAKD